MRSRKFFVLLGFLTALSFILGSQVASALNPAQGWHSANQISSGTMTGPITVYGGTFKVVQGGGEIKMGDDSNPYLELRAIDGGVPYIDFINDAYADFDGRIILESDDSLKIDGSSLVISNSLNVGKDITSGAGIKIGNAPQQGTWQSRAPQRTSWATTSISSTAPISMTINSDGLPIIGYQKSSGLTSIRIFFCDSMECWTGTDTDIEDIAPEVWSVSVTMGADGFPVILYTSTFVINIWKCNDIRCTTKTGVGLRSTGDNGPFTDGSIAIKPDGNPILLFYSIYTAVPGYKGLNMIVCTSADCSQRDPRIVVDDIALEVGQYNSIAIGSDFYPIMSYWSYDPYTPGNNGLKFIRCTNPSCTSRDRRMLDIGNIGQYTSLTVGSDGFPVISYYDQGNADLKLYKCTNIGCTVGTARTLDSTGNVGKYTSITIGSDGYPMISYYDESLSGLKLYKCGDVDCSKGVANFVVSGGSRTSMAIGSDGLPIISHVGSDSSIKVAKCGNPYCHAYWARR